MLGLASTTPASWLDGILPHLDEVLVDHAHCEKKAASTAMNLMFRYADRPELMLPLSMLAREELEHFEQALALLEQRGVPFGPSEPPPYAKELSKSIRRGEPHRLLDTLLICSLIEARSCERMKVLASGLEGDLKRWMVELLACEARHFSTYVDLAKRFVAPDEVNKRLAELTAIEATVIAGAPAMARLHAAGA